MAEAKQTRPVTSANKVFRVVEGVFHAVSVLGFGLVTTVLEVYLRLLDHFHRLKQLSLVDLNSNTENLPEDHRRIPIWLTDVSKHLLLLGQKCLTYRALLSIVALTLPKFAFVDQRYWICLAISISILALPRIIFAIFIVAEQRDLLSSRGKVKDPNRHVNVSIRLVGYAYNGIRKTFKSLNGIERLFLLLSQYFQYVFLQLLGYNYSDYRIMLYSELESFLFVFYSSILRRSEMGASLDVLMLLGVYFVRILLQQAQI